MRTIRTFKKDNGMMVYAFRKITLATWWGMIGRRRLEMGWLSGLVQLSEREMEWAVVVTVDLGKINLALKKNLKIIYLISVWGVK